CCLMFDVVFFFSSRRRHTRFSRDWSSDVCSSDLNSPMVDDAVDSCSHMNAMFIQRWDRHYSSAERNGRDNSYLSFSELLCYFLLFGCVDSRQSKAMTQIGFPLETWILQDLLNQVFDRIHSRLSRFVQVYVDTFVMIQCELYGKINRLLDRSVNRVGVKTANKIYISLCSFLYVRNGICIIQTMLR